MKYMWLLLVAAGILMAADESSSITLARKDLARVREQVNAGLLPASRIAEAQEAINDALDQDILDRTLYAHLEIEDLSAGQASEMEAAAQRRVDRAQARVDRGVELVANGIAAPGMFTDVRAELARRTEALAQAKTRAGLITQIVEIARAEAGATAGREEAAPGVWRAREFVDGDHLLEPKDIKDVTLAYESKFHEPFPVSARGATAVHRAMGFDHTGRIDVAVNPDSAEGAWLRAYLDAKAIPYYVFRIAIPGKATAPHIHIGPGSTRIHPTD
jgi:hypothetical protein